MARPCRARKTKSNDAYTLRELRELARKRGLRFGKKGKAALCSMLSLSEPGPSPSKKIEVVRTKAENPVSQDAVRISSPYRGPHARFDSFVECRGAVIKRHASGKFPMAFKLRPHQARAVQRVMDPGCRGVLLYFGVGSGKTFASLCSAEALMLCGHVDGVVAVMPAGLVDNYKKEMRATGASGSRYKVMSYEAACKDGPDTKNKLLVVDEAHNIRNPKGTFYRKIKALGNAAAKVVLLTGTPVQNFPHEITPIINIIEDDLLPPDKDAFEYYFGPSGLEGGDLLYEISKHVVYYSPPQNSKDYPRLETLEYFVLMAPAQAEFHYAAVEGNNYGLAQIAENAQDLKFNMSFFMDPRKIANAVYVKRRWICPKLQLVADNVAKAARSGQKSIVYSFFIERGIDLVARLLGERGVQCAAITGKQSQAARSAAVKNYNEDRLPVLVISEAGSEGLDLKHTRHVHIVEPSWNEEVVNQVVGRGRRYKSHTRPDVEPLVQVHRYYSTLPGEDHVPLHQKHIGNTSADTIIGYISHGKNDACKEFLGAVVQASFEEFKELDIYSK